MRITVAALVLILSSTSSAFSQEWRGIVLLKSTCEEVKLSLGVDKCDIPMSRYRLEGEIVTIHFSQSRCSQDCAFRTREYNVPPGTVIEITRILDEPLPLTDFHVDNNKWGKTFTDFLNEVIYGNEEEGLTISAVNNQVKAITYYPALKSKYLRCAPCASNHSQGNKKIRRTRKHKTRHIKPLQNRIR